jgi:curved DNA-binding protein CbpA
MHSGRGVSETSSSRARRRADAGGDGAVSDDPFALLGLPTRAGLSDDDVRAAWRRIAAATHPDREDGGDPARFGAAAAAYVVLRTGFGRGEALADLGLGLGGTADHRGRHAHRRRRAADPAAPGAGRHRARHEAAADRRAGARLPRLSQLRGWITRRAASHGPADAAKRGPADAAGPGSAAAAAHMSGEATGHAPGEATTHGSPGEATAYAPGEPITYGSPGEATAYAYASEEPITYGSAGEAAAHAPAGWYRNCRSTGSRLRSRPIGRPGGLAVRVACAAVVGVVAIVISGWSPGVVGVLAGVLTWLLAAAGRAFARRRSR